MITRPSALLLAATVILATSTFAGENPAHIKVACVGDSITVGVGIRASDREKYGYTAQLQDLLGDKYSVNRFGKSGATMLKKGNLPYWEQAAFKSAQMHKPDIVVIVLGANDAKTRIGRNKGGNWAHKADFKDNYVEMVKVFQNPESKPKVYVCYPIPAYENKHAISGDVVKNEIIPFIDQVAKETGATIIDLHKPLEGKPELLADGVHPNKDGAKVMAETIAAAIAAKTGEDNK